MQFKPSVGPPTRLAVCEEIDVIGIEAHVSSTVAQSLAGVRKALSSRKVQIALGFVVAAVPLVALASPISVPKPFVTSTVISSGHMNENFAAGAYGDNDSLSASSAVLAQFVTDRFVVSSGRMHLPIVDLQATSSTITIAADATIADLDVTVNIDHTYDGDLSMTLTSPAGRTVRLSTRRGGSGDNFRNTVFDSEAAIAINQGTAPFTGSYKPEDSLTIYNGKHAAGAWHLRVQDWANGDTGTLLDWSLAILPSPKSPSADVGDVIDAVHAADWSDGRTTGRGWERWSAPAPTCGSAMTFPSLDGRRSRARCSDVSSAGPRCLRLP